MRTIDSAEARSVDHIDGGGSLRYQAELITNDKWICTIFVLDRVIAMTRLEVSEIAFQVSNDPSSKSSEKLGGPNLILGLIKGLKKSEDPRSQGAIERYLTASSNGGKTKSRGSRASQ